jgi:outer membrane autotransporter protein
LIIVPHKNFNFEFVGGWSTTKGNDNRRWVTSQRNPITGVSTQIDNKFSCSPKSKAMFGGVFANFVNKVNKASFSLQVGYLMMQSKMDKFKETSASAAYAANAKSVPSNTFKTQTATAKVLVGYQMTPSVMPFLNVHGQYDVKQNKGVTFAAGNQKAYQINRSAFGGGAGLQVKNDDQLSGSLQFDYTKRGQLTTNVTGLRLHYGF